MEDIRHLIVKSALWGSVVLVLLCSLLLSKAQLTSLADSAADPTSGASQDCRASARFPDQVLQWCSLITTYAEQFALPVDLLVALIWYESGGDPLAYSHSGAVGLMQVMPRDGLAASFSCPSGPCFASRPTIAELQDPEFNIAYGTRYLASLIERSGDVREALKSYGPINVGYTYADKVLEIYRSYSDSPQDLP